MTAGATPKPNAPVGGDSEEAARIALELARGAINEEFAITDRLEAKARSMVTVGGAFFAVAQAVAVPLFRDISSAPHVARAWEIAIIAAIAVGAVGALAGVATASIVWRARTQQAISIDMVDALSSNELSGMPARVALRHVSGIARARRADNLQRARRLTLVSTSWWVTACAAAVEVLIAALARLEA